MHPEWALYMPDGWSATKKTERGFFWQILTTLQNDYVCDLIRDCRRQRHQLNQQRSVRVQRDLHIAQNWAALLLEEEFTSCKWPFPFFLCPGFHFSLFCAQLERRAATCLLPGGPSPGQGLDRRRETSCPPC